MKRHPKRGSAVTCRYAIEAFYSGYSGRPVCTFRPGMVGTVVSPKRPKVHKPQHTDDPRFDMREFGVLVDFIDVTGTKQRVFLNLCNCFPIKAQP